MTSVQIKNLQNILNRDIVTYTVTRLTAPGENYGSLMLRVDIDVGKDMLHAVAKAVPPDEATRKHFNTEETFRNEIGFYKEIVPCLQSFQKSCGIDDVISIFPKYFGSRLNLLNNDDLKVDIDGALLLENLKVSGYRNMNRREGLDLNVAVLVIKDLAKFHAVPIALRYQKRDLFGKKIVPFLSPCKTNLDFHNNTKKKLEQLVDELSDIQIYKERILETFDKRLIKSECREPFVTIVHNDFWVNNVMTKFEGSEPIQNKFVDFQECIFGSLAKDLVFFLFSSVKSQILESNYDTLIKLYYDTFISTLTQHNFPEKISFDDFIKELAFEATHSQLAHLAFMLFPIFASLDNKGEIASNPEELLNTTPSQLHREKLIFIVQQFAKRNWL